MLLSTIHREIGTKKSFKAWLKANGYEGDAEVSEGEALALILNSKNERAKRKAVENVTSLFSKVGAIVARESSYDMRLPEGWYRQPSGSVALSSKVLASLLGKHHKDVMKSIRLEIGKLEDEISRRSFDPAVCELTVCGVSATDIDSMEQVLKGFSLQKYESMTGEMRPQYILKEEAALYMAAKHSVSVRATLAVLFKRLSESQVEYLEAASLAKGDLELRPMARRLYIMYDYERSLSKVGIAKDPEKRLETFSTVSNSIELVWQSPLATNVADIEAEIHKNFKDRDAFGEWFSVSPEELFDYIKALTFKIAFK